MSYGDLISNSSPNRFKCTPRYGSWQSSLAEHLPRLRVYWSRLAFMSWAAFSVQFLKIGSRSTEVLLARLTDVDTYQSAPSIRLGGEGGCSRSFFNLMKSTERCICYPFTAGCPDDSKMANSGEDLEGAGFAGRFWPRLLHDFLVSWRKKPDLDVHVRKVSYFSFFPVYPWNQPKASIWHGFWRGPTAGW